MRAMQGLPTIACVLIKRMPASLVLKVKVLFCGAWQGWYGTGPAKVLNNCNSSTVTWNWKNLPPILIPFAQKLLTSFADTNPNPSPYGTWALEITRGSMEFGITSRAHAWQSVVITDTYNPLKREKRRYKILHKIWPFKTWLGTSHFHCHI